MCSRKIFRLVYGEIRLFIILPNSFYFSISLLAQPSRSRLQSKEHTKEDVCVERNLPPSIEGPVYAILIFHVPKLRWLPKYQPLYRSPTIKVAWWGEESTSAIFK